MIFVSGLLILCSLLNSSDMLRNLDSFPAPHHQLESIKPVIDTVAPTVFCITGGNTLSLPSTGCIIIWAKDLDRGSFDDITPVNKLKFYLDGDPNKLNTQICCSDFTVANACDEYPVSIDLWVEDENGNIGICKTNVIIQDDLDACGCQSTGYAIKGFINTECNLRAEGMLTLRGPNNYNRSSNAPYIRFYELTNGNYQLCLSRTDGPRNGVTTADIVKIQRHILGLEPFQTNAQRLSADVTNSSSITATDITEIRKLILGIKSQFSNVPSWIFVPVDSISNPVLKPEVKDYKDGCWNLIIDKASLPDINFTSLKMGDVNCTARLTDNIINRQAASNQEKIIFNVLHTMEGPLIHSAFNLKYPLNIQGFQFTLKFDPTKLEFFKFQSGDIPISNENVSLLEVSQGKIHLSWNHDQEHSSRQFTKDAFSIIWKKNSPDISEVNLEIDPHEIIPLCINENLDELPLILQNIQPGDFLPIQLKHDIDHGIIYFNRSIHQNPNIVYFLTDLNGRKLLEKELQLNNGDIIYIDLTGIKISGFYLLTIQSGEFNQTYKLIL